MKKQTFLICILLFTVFLTACGILPGSNSKRGEYDLQKVSHDVTTGNKTFAFDIFKKLNEEDANENVFISPISISQALAMAYNGADTTTKQAMEQVLGFSETERDIVNESYFNLMNYIESADNKIELANGNSIWVRKGVNVKSKFIRTNENYFNAEVNTLDFSGDNAVDTINKWIDKATKGMITGILNPPIPDDAVMYLRNAIYFKGKWSDQFNPKYTYDGHFAAVDGSLQKVKMMNKPKASVKYAGTDEYKAIRLPYGEGKIAMYVILPSEGTNINDFIAGMTAEKWDEIRGCLKDTEDVFVKIPRFKLEYGTKDLVKSLTSLGMGEAFGENADFSVITDDVYISRVLHKAIIEVNEEGSEASAATIVEFIMGAMRDPVTFIADRPFIFIINEDVTDTIIFMGKAGRINE